ncbi:uncharacterized protein Dwil_GK28161 [Drosophila willistoni]|uniref:Uncharacterized protein n=1 Tax=Drosophila willistoni TaxID=7260 RepID=A0A0Q9X281_DROWI|nr:uncharacterized protein Dwil_GK28161 [Drosophila willistoni]
MENQLRQLVARSSLENVESKLQNMENQLRQVEGIVETCRATPYKHVPSGVDI